MFTENWIFCRKIACFYIFQEIEIIHFQTEMGYVVVISQSCLFNDIMQFLFIVIKTGIIVAAQIKPVSHSTVSEEQDWELLQLQLICSK